MGFWTSQTSSVFNKLAILIENIWFKSLMKQLLTMNAIAFRASLWTTVFIRYDLSMTTCQSSNKALAVEFDSSGACRMFRREHRYLKQNRTTFLVLKQIKCIFQKKVTLLKLCKTLHLKAISQSNIVLSLTTKDLYYNWSL